MDAQVRRVLDRGVVIPACPLALTVQRSLDERRQQALCRYYAAAGVGGWPSRFTPRNSPSAISGADDQ